MTHPQPETKLYRLLKDQGRSQAWLARKLRVKRQTVGPWLRAEEPTPAARRAQIAVTLEIKAADYFDLRGFAVTHTE